jgi:predicted component of type VI protein secretion system
MSEDLGEKTHILRPKPAPVATKAPPAQLHCVDTSVLKNGVGALIKLGDGEVAVGRGDENQACLHAQGVSRNHARVFFENGAWTVEDLGSTNGTRVNNSKLDKKQVLTDGDTVAFGRACYKFQILKDSDKGAQPAVDIDLGAGEKTVIMRPSGAAASAAAPAAKASAKPAAPAAPKPAPQAAPKPAPQAAPEPAPQAAAPESKATAQAAPPKTRPSTAAKPQAPQSTAAKKTGSNNAVLWIIVIVAVAALALGGARFAGLL